MFMKTISRMVNLHLHLHSLVLLAVLGIVHAAADDNLFHGNVSNGFNVEDYGALGDGIHDNTEAFTNAWNTACKAQSATLLVPGTSKTFMVNNIIFQGPCAPGFTFQVDGTIVAPKDPKSWKNTNMLLLFQQLQQFTLTGFGTINGQGDPWWAGCNVSACTYPQRPVAVHFSNSNEVIIRGLTIAQTPAPHLTMDNCQNVTIHSININSPGNSPNTDGIDIGSSKNITIEDSVIGAGDDCVAFGDGSSQMFIKNLTCGPGHGISIGSLGRSNSSARVSKIIVNGVTVTGTQNGVRIKSWQGGSGMANMIVFKNIEMVNVGNPIIIDQYYCNNPEPCPNQTSAVHIKDVTFENIHGSSATPVAVKLACSDTVACTGIVMNDINLMLNSKGEASAFCENAHGKANENVHPPSCLQN